MDARNLYIKRYLIAETNGKKLIIQYAYVKQSTRYATE